MTDFDALDMAAARAKFAQKIDGRKSARKGRQQKLSNAVDGRSLRKTGRTEHLNFKATTATKSALADLKARLPKGDSVSRWLEDAIVEKLRREGVEHAPDGGDSDA